ncbi:hypothetical protein LCGC14_0678540 [marine sediment metagenome]|uniref:Uncharacterized protein n=2 Tax=root TaxID=1 RepID=A0A9C9NI69_9HYPH|nr:hypothetical protein [Aurantimonas coralicida]
MKARPATFQDLAERIRDLEQRLEAAEGLLDRASEWAIATGHSRRSLFRDIRAFLDGGADD